MRSKLKIADRPLSQTKAVLLAIAALYAVYLPIGLWLDADYQSKQRPAPAGAVVQLIYFRPIKHMDITDDNRGKVFYGTVFRWRDRDGKPPQDQAKAADLAIYENGLSLGSPHLEYVGGSGEYSLAFSTSDNSDPRSNGRDYWIVRR